jgi:nitroimidazol reductase NimA-like FMN-containing flavoprotein (pyridoxamine 5'-phosphate oxidase superfamily)
MPPVERLSDDRIERYLATKEVVVLATLGPEGAPRAMAMWFLHDGLDLVMISVADTHKVTNLRQDPRVAVVAESVGPAGDIRGVAVRGRALFLEDSPERRGLAERFLARYHPRLERLWGGRAMPGNRAMFRIAPEHVRSWGLG